MSIRDALTGMLLGDAHISATPRGNSQLSFKHSFKQAEYARFKAEMLSDAGYPMRAWEEWTTLEKTGRSYGRICYRTGRHSFFSTWRSRWYPGGVKTVVKDTITRMGKVGLCLWFLDDGSVHYSHGMVNALKISTDCFDRLGHDLLQAYVEERWGLKARIYRRKDSLLLFFPIDEAKRLRDLIMPIAEKVPSMLYKLRIGEKQ